MKHLNQINDTILFLPKQRVATMVVSSARSWYYANHLPTEFKVETIRRYEKGASIKALSQELYISQSTLYQWWKEYRSIEMPNRTYTPAEFGAMPRRLKKSEHYMEIIHRSGYLSSVPLRKKLTPLEELYNRPDNPYSVHGLCDALGGYKRNILQPHLSQSRSKQVWGGAGSTHAEGQTSIRWQRTTLWPKHFSRHSREKKPTGRTIPLNNISAEA